MGCSVDGIVVGVIVLGDGSVWEVVCDDKVSSVLIWTEGITVDPVIVN